MNEIVTSEYFKRASSAEIIDLIDELQKQYPTAKVNIKAYGRVMSEYPQWALQRAVTDLLLGKVEDVDASFCPPAPKIAQVAKVIADAKRKEFSEARRRKRQEAEQRALMEPSGKTQEMKDRVAKLVENLKSNIQKLNEKENQPSPIPKSLTNPATPFRMLSQAEQQARIDGIRADSERGTIAASIETKNALQRKWSEL
ncbi:MAG: hypothetical protein GY943_30475 [Chloroflexi bacterium]|nr:hypothetical protein [Chloroflexota bacterium]